MIVWIAMMVLLFEKVHITPLDIRKIPDHESLGDTEEWASIYLHDQKVGYSLTNLTKNKNGYTIREHTFMRLRVMDVPQKVATHMVCQVDDDFLLKSFNFRLVSGVMAFRAEGEVRDHKLLLMVETGGEKSHKEIRLSKIPFLSQGLRPFLVRSGLKVGEKHSLPFWDPTTQTYHEAVVEVEGKEPVTINDASYTAFRIRTDLMGMTLRSWVSLDGELLKEQGSMGVLLVRSSRKEALSDITTEPTDILSAVSIPSSPIEKPRSSKYLKVQLYGVPIDDFDLDGGRQKVKGDLLEVTQEKVNPHLYYQIPNIDKRHQEYLKPSLMIQSNHPEIIQTAHNIIGNERNSLRITQLLTQWVYEYLEKKPTLSVPSAIEVLRHKVGDCNEHTALLTALLRAVGIPARSCAGILYSEGRFYYHAWLEAFLGHWISVDPTLNQMPTDATHIKFIEGGLNRQVEMLKIIGNVNLDIIEVR